MYAVGGIVDNQGMLRQRLLQPLNLTYHTETAIEAKAQNKGFIRVLSDPATNGHGIDIVTRASLNV